MKDIKIETILALRERTGFHCIRQVSKNFQSNELKVNQFELSCIHRVSLSSTFKSKDEKFPNTFNFQTWTESFNALHATQCTVEHFVTALQRTQGSMTWHSQVPQPTCYWTGRCFILNFILLLLLSQTNWLHLETWLQCLKFN